MCKSNASAGLEFLKSLTKLVNVIANDKVAENIRRFFFGAKLIALVKKDGGLRPIVIGNTIARVVAKCAEQHGSITGILTHSAKQQLTFTGTLHAVPKW